MGSAENGGGSASGAQRAPNWDPPPPWDVHDTFHRIVKIWVKSNFELFQQFLDVFSLHDDRINFSSFALCQVSGVPTKGTLEDFFSDFWRVVGKTCGSLGEIKIAGKNPENWYMAS